MLVSEAISTAKMRIASALMPLTRGYVRYGPPGYLRDKLWRWSRWRTVNYEVKTRFGARMKGNSLDLVQGYIYYFGIWEPNLTAFLARRLTGCVGRTFIDVGANVGYFSLLASMKLGKGNSVVSIEAFPSIHEKLRTNLCLNDLSNVRTILAAASDRETTIDLFYAGPSNEGGTTTVPGRVGTQSVKVLAQPLATMLDEIEIASLRVMKIDVEGAEWSVLSGLSPVMKQVPDDAEFVVEVNPESNGRADDIFEFFSSLGFCAYSLENSYDAQVYLSNKKISKPTRIRKAPTVQTDIVFSRLNTEEL